MPYQVQDSLNQLYDGSAITSDGNSSEINVGCDGGCPDMDLVLNIGDMEGTGTLSFILQDYVSGSFVDTAYQIVLAATKNGVYTWPIDNRMVTGYKFRLRHDITAGTDSDGVTVHGHGRVRR